LVLNTWGANSCQEQKKYYTDLQRQAISWDQVNESIQYGGHQVILLGEYHNFIELREHNKRVLQTIIDGAKESTGPIRRCALFEFKQKHKSFFEQVIEAIKNGEKKNEFAKILLPIDIRHYILDFWDIMSMALEQGWELYSIDISHDFFPRNQFMADSIIDLHRTGQCEQSLFIVGQAHLDSYLLTSEGFQSPVQDLISTHSDLSVLTLGTVPVKVHYPHRDRLRKEHRVCDKHCGDCFEIEHPLWLSPKAFIPVWQYAQDYSGRTIHYSTIDHLIVFPVITEAPIPNFEWQIPVIPQFTHNDL
jgi:hypothetical protein